MNKKKTKEKVRQGPQSVPQREDQECEGRVGTLFCQLCADV